MKPFPKKNHQNGFTLIEVVVAISIFAVLGFGCYKVVHGLSLARDRVTKKSEDLRELVNAINTINRDFTQLSPRKIQDETGKDHPAFDTHGDYTVEFTRKGVPNPLMVKRAKVLRIAYRFSEELDRDELKQIENNKSILNSIGDGKEGYLLRYIWPVLDRGDDMQPKMQIVLTGINDLEFEFLDEKNKWLDEWPQSVTTQTAATTDLPYAVKIRFSSKKYGKLERFFQIRSLPLKP